MDMLKLSYGMNAALYSKQFIKFYAMEEKDRRTDTQLSLVGDLNVDPPEWHSNVPTTKQCHIHLSIFFGPMRNCVHGRKIVHCRIRQTKNLSIKQKVLGTLENVPTISLLCKNNL